MQIFDELESVVLQEMALAGWKLQHNSGDDETVFKFHRTLIIKPKEYCTVNICKHIVKL